MKSHRIFKRLLSTALVLLLALAPLAFGQRRKRPRQPRRTTATNTQQKPATQEAAKPKAPAAVQAQSPKPTPAPAAAKLDEREDFETERAFEEVITAEGYALVVEIRRLGHLVRSKEAKELLDIARSLSVGMKEVEESINFFTSNAEQLNDVTAYSVALPTRAGLPQFIAAYQFASADAARAFEPKARGLLGKYQKSEKDVQAAQEASAKRAPSPTPSDSEGVEPDKGLSFIVKRYGRLILMTNESFTLKSLRAEGEQSLTNNARFQSLRGRLSTEPVFLYLDIKLMDRSTQVMREAYAKQQGEQMPTETTDAMAQAEAEEMQREIARIEAEARAEAEAQSRAETPPPPEADATPPAPVAMVGEINPATGEMQVRVEGTNEAMLSSGGGDIFTSLLFGSFLGGGMQWPEVVGAALALEGDAIVARALVINPAGDYVQPLPFLPTVISGPLYTPQAASAAPADTEVFVSASLDLNRIYNRMILSMDEGRARMREARMEAGVAELGVAESAKKSEETENTEKMIAAAEKLLGFKIKEDFIPALGNEVALSAPLKWFMGDFRYNHGHGAPKKDEGKEPVILVSLNNADAMRKMLPRILELAGIKSFTAQEQTINHAGIEIKNYGPLSSAYLGNFLALSWDVASIKRVAESASGQGVLASDERYRASTAWQPRVKLAEAYVSRSLIDSLLEEFTKWADPKDPEVQQTLARMNIRPEAATYVVTNEGGGELMHELRLPTAIIKFFAVGNALERKIAPIRNGEGQALMTLSFIRNAQEDFKREKGKGSYASLEELSPKPKAKQPVRQSEEDEDGMTEDYSFNYHPLNKSVLEKLGYQIALISAGDKYTVVATPREYGKSGRRSFFMDETGIIRAAHRKGEPATADDPPID